MRRWRATAPIVLCVGGLAASLSPVSGQQWEVPRTEYGHPDLQGNWTNATLTRLERRPGLEPVYSRAEVEEIEGRQRARVQQGYEPSDPDRPAPEPGDLGTYNQVYFDGGDRVAVVDGEARTSLITFPADGRIPPLNAEGRARKEAHEAFRARFEEYDHPELRPPAERCVVYYASSVTGVLGTPMSATSGYNNNFTIVQNEDHLLIHAEMIHDTRIIRLGEPKPLPADQRPWFGESWGRWEGDTLVVETTQVHPDQGIRKDGWILHSERLRMIERFSRPDEDTILYEFTIEDPGTYTQVWGGQASWQRFDEQIYEYGCHEGNYALANVLSGARYQERQR